MHTTALGFSANYLNYRILCVCNHIMISFYSCWSKGRPARLLFLLEFDKIPRLTNMSRITLSLRPWFKFLSAVINAFAAFSNVANLLRRKWWAITNISAALRPNAALNSHRQADQISPSVWTSFTISFGYLLLQSN